MIRTCRTLLIAAAFALGAAAAQACPACVGDPTSPLAQGAKAGVLFLAALIYLQLMGIAAVGVYFYMRARRIARETGQDSLF